MKRFNLEKYEYLLPIICSLVYFLTVKNIVSSLYYGLIAIVIALYFFPLKLILISKNRNNFGQNKFVRIFSFLVISTIAILPMLILVNNNQELVRVFKVVSLINCYFLFHSYIKEYDRSTLFTHIGFTILSSAVIGI